MKSKYPLVPLGDISSVGDGAHSKVARVETGIPYLTSKNIGQGILKLEKLDLISNESFEKLFPKNSKATRRPQAGDVLIGIIGTFGNAYLYKEDDHFGFSSSIGIIRPDTNLLVPEYLYCAITSKYFKSNHENHNAGSVQGYTNIPTIKSLPIPLPPIESQKKIAEILLTFDRKISINTQTNQILESIAQAIFKSWFVDFEPVKAKMATLAEGGTREQAELAAMGAISGKSEAELAQLQQQNPEHYQQLAETAALFPSAMVESELGEIPEGWEVGTYEQIIEFNPKRSIKKGQLAPYLDMQNVPTSGHCADEVILREMNSGTKFVNGDTLLARITPCLENGKTAFVDFLKSDETGWGSTEFIVMRMKDDLPTSISYFVARQESFRSIAIQSMTGTSGRQRAEAKVIGASSTVIPPKELLIKFGHVSNRHLALASANHKESKTLAELRDSLLPKLLSGELDLSDIQSEVA